MEESMTDHSYQAPGITKYAGRPNDDTVRNESETAVYDFLDRLGIAYTTLCHPAAFTMEECEAVRKRLDAPVFKNLFLTNRQQTEYYLLMIPADKPFKTKYLSSQLGCARLSFASPEAMMEMLHIAPGAVSPMGLIHDTSSRVRLIIDSDLAAIDTYACHPCVNTASIALSLSDLLEKIIPATGHTYTGVPLPVEGYTAQHDIYPSAFTPRIRRSEGYFYSLDRALANGHMP